MCSGRNTFQVTSYARKADGTKLNRLYTHAYVDAADDFIYVTLTQDYESSYTTAHAVYVRVADSSSASSANIFCFTVSSDPTDNLCRSICNEAQLVEAASDRIESYTYFIKSTPTSDTVEFSDNFTLMSSNEVMCPVLYWYTKDSDNHSQATDVVLAFDVATADFFVQTDDTALLVSNSMGYSIYSVTGVTDSYAKTMPFTVFFDSCDSAYLVPIKDFKIVAHLAATGDSLTYTYLDLGFESSDPTNCPITDTTIFPVPTTAAVFCIYSDVVVYSDCYKYVDGVTDVEWVLDNTSSLLVTRLATTVVDNSDPPAISVELTVGGVAYNNIITSLTITTCDAACASCDPSNLSINSLVSSSADWIS